MPRRSRGHGCHFQVPSDGRMCDREVEHDIPSRQKPHSVWQKTERKELEPKLVSGFGKNSRDLHQ
jgi:hypothetical protein